MAILHKAFSSPPVCCYFISFPNLLDSCDSAVKYSYNDSRKDRLSHFYHLLSFVLYTLYHLIIVNKSVIFKNFFIYVFAHLSLFLRHLYHSFSKIIFYDIDKKYICDIMDTRGDKNEHDPKHISAQA